MKIQNFKISKFSGKFSKFQNLEFSLTFSSKIFVGQKSKIFGPKKISTKKFSDFSDEMFFDKNIFEHLFRSQISPRFQKTHLEEHGTILKLRKRRSESPGTKVPVFLYILTSEDYELRKPSVY